MGSPWLSRLAVAAAAAGALTFAAAAPAAAHEEPADGFDVVLHDDHHDKLADYFEDGCDDVRSASPSLIKDGFDVWVFNIESGQFDTGAGVKTLSVLFEKPDHTQVTVDVPPVTENIWIGPDANKHLVAVSVPVGWKLLDGDANVLNAEGKEWFVVTHTCAGTSTTPPGNGTTPPGNGTTPPGNGTTPPGNGTTSPGAGGGLPVTGVPAAGILVGGIALLAGGVALMAVRRRRAVSELTES